jgi:hypothetical protein
MMYPARSSVSLDVCALNRNSFSLLRHFLPPARLARPPLLRLAHPPSTAPTRPIRWRTRAIIQRFAVKKYPEIATLSES